MFLDRDHSILAFNERVMDWARRTDVPLLERLRYLSIVSSNLDEFFEVRMAPQLAARKAHEQRGTHTEESYERVSATVHALVAQQYAIYNDELLPLLQKQGVELVSHGERDAAQRRWVKAFFEREVQPLLMPVDVCINRAALSDAIGHIDWRMAWAADSLRGLLLEGRALDLARALGGGGIAGTRLDRDGQSHLAYGRFEIAGDIDGERLQGRNVERVERGLACSCSASERFRRT